MSRQVVGSESLDTQPTQGDANDGEMGGVMEGAEMAAALSATAKQAREVVVQLASHMGVDAKVDVEEFEERVEVVIGGRDASLLVGKRGQTLDSLQYIVNRIMTKQVGEHKLIVVNSDGYRERREASLVELAKRLSEKAQVEGKIVALNPMSARDRRIIHLTLRDTPGVSTRSEGDGEDRRLLIVPE